MAGAEPRKASAREEWRRNWRLVLAAGLGFALSSVTVYSVGPFIAPLEAEFGWSRAQITSGMTLYSVLGILLAPLVGVGIDRYGPRRIALIGIVGYFVTFSALSLTTSSIFVWLGLWFVLAVASAPMKPTTWTAGVSSVFDAGRGLAISVMLCGAGLGSSLTPILSTWLIDAYGWRIAYIGLIGTFVLFVLPAVALFFSSAQDRRRVSGRTDATGRQSASHGDAPPLPGLTWREGLASWKFARLAAAATVTTLVIISFVSNLVPIFSSQGIGRTQAAAVAGLIGVSTIVGRLVGGHFLDKVNGSIVGGISLLMPLVCASLVLANPGSVAAATVAVLILGLSLGAELDCVAYLTTRHFGLRNFGTIFGVIAGLLAFSSGAGPFLVNLSYDMTGNYDLAIKAYLPLSLLASALFFSLGRYPTFAVEEPAEALVDVTDGAVSKG